MAEGEVLAGTDQSFAKDVLEAKGLVVVDFWAPWCGPCRRLGPLLEDLAKEYAGRVQVVKINVDENPQRADEFKVRSIPNMVFFLNGQKVEQQVGLLPKGDLKALIDKLLTAKETN